jgi:hypothetical protein
MIELGQLSVSILDKDEKVVLFSFMEGEYFHAFKGQCDEICNADANDIIKINGFGFYNNIVHSLELEDFYTKMNTISSKFKNLKPSSTDKAYEECLEILQRCQDKKNYGFRVTLLENNNIEINFLVEDRQFTLSGEKEYDIGVDDKNLIVTEIDDVIPFMNYVIDDMYVDLTALIPVEQSILFLKQIVEGLIEKYDFKITNSFNVEGNEI